MILQTTDNQFQPYPAGVARHAAVDRNVVKVQGRSHLDLTWRVHDSTQTRTRPKFQLVTLGAEADHPKIQVFSIDPGESFFCPNLPFFEVMEEGRHCVISHTPFRFYP